MIKVSQGCLGEEEIKEVLSAFEYGYFVLAAKVDEFEKEIKGYASKTTQLRVLGEWLNHRPINARKLLNNTDLGKISRFGYLVLTFFPTSIFFPLYKLRYRIRSFVS